MVRESSSDFLRIDISNGKTKKIISACQSESVHRTIHFLLSNNGTPVDLTNIFYAEILIRRVNGTETDNACIIDGEDIQYTLRSNDISVVGENECHLFLTFNDGTTLETPVFYLNVFSSFYNQAALQSQNEYGSLGQQVLNAKSYADNAEASAGSAQDYATNAQTYANSAQTAASEAAVSRSETAEYKSETADYLNSTSEYMVSASEYASEAGSNAAVTSNNVDSTSTYTSQASVLKSETASYMTSTSEYASSASEYAAVASSNATLTAGYMASTSEYTSEAASEASFASSCADEAEAWYKQAEAIAEGFEGTLIPMGTVTFANLPAIADAKSGWMYNVSDEFETTNDFLDGAGLIVPAGSNVYLTAQDKWDVLAGSPVTGVKGEAQQFYSRGNVTITKSSIGLGNVRNEDIGTDDISSIGATVKAAIIALFNKFTNYQPLLTNPLTKADVVNDLVTTTTNVPLSAAQGKALNDSLATKAAANDLIALAARVTTLEGMIGYPISQSNSNNNS